MRFNNYINEVLKIDKSLVHGRKIRKSLWTYTGNVEVEDGDNIMVFVEMKYLVSLHPPTWLVSFAAQDNKFEALRSRITMKETIKILNIVVSAFDDFLQKEKPKKFEFFEATHMKGGMKLYTKFAEHILKNYPYKRKDLGNNKVFHFVRK